MLSFLLRRAAPVLAVMATFAGAPAVADPRPGIVFTLGAGARIAPEYFGSDSRSVGPAGRVGLQELRLPGGFGFGSPDAQPLDPGFGFGGSFRFIGSRKTADFPELAGLNDVSRALELGLEIRQVHEFWRVFAAARYGVVGHSAWAGEVGADAILRATDRLILTAGPRASFGSARFQRTYFGITPAEAAASGLAAHAPSSGLVSVGAEIGMRYALDRDWGIEGAITWDRLQGDAGRSPIVAQGSRDQIGARLLVTRRFSFGG